jgi:predicted amidohydrolase
MMPPLVKIILIQPLPVAQLDSPENVDRAVRLLERCRGQEADLICFPEYFPFSGDAALAQAARELQAYVVAGLVEESGGRRYNTATLFDREGNLVGRQRKCTLGNLERKGFGVTPGSGFEVMDTDFGRLGLAVCIDFWGQPEAARMLTDQGADLVVNPSIFPILRGHWPQGALVRAFDNYLPVVGVNTASFVSEIAGRHYPMFGGGSFAIQPPGPEDGGELSRLVRNWDDLQDWLILKADDAEQLLTIQLNLVGPRFWRPVIWGRFGIQR